MDGDTHRLFQRVANKLGWAEKGGLETAEDELIRSISKTRHPATGGYSSSLALSFPSPDHLHLSDSDGGSGKENQPSRTNDRTTVLIESSDDDFDQFLLEKATPKASARKPRKPHNAAKQVSEPVLVVSSDSDDSFEKFLNRVKTPKPKLKTAAGSGSEDSLKKFIVDSLSSDDDFAFEKKTPPTSKVFKTPKPPAAQPLARRPLSRCDSPVFLSESDEEDGIVMKGTWRTRHPVRQKPSQTRKVKVRESDQEDISPSPTPSPLPTVVASPLPSSSARPPFHAPSQRTYSAPTKPADSASSSSEEEFLSLLDRLKKNKISSKTLTPKHVTVSIQKPPLSVPRPGAPKQTGPLSVGRTPLDMKTPAKTPVTRPKISQTEPRPIPISRVVVCKTPGCFLQSLSSYSRNFKQTKEDLTSKLYQLYNTSIFDSKLPTNMSLTWNKKLRKTAGYCVTGQERGGGNRYARIDLSVKVCDSADRLRDTLVHEMCHAATWLINGVRDGHGPFWKIYARKATLAHSELPMVTRCHSYDINYKFKYQCNRCENTIGRHSKSLDTERFVCSLCSGRLVLLTPSTPRAPTPFATFVKENFGAVRQELVGQSHGDVMRKLSADFATKTRVSQS